MDEEGQPFDARKSRMCEDREAPRARWRTSSLVVELQDALISRLPLDQQERAREIQRFDLAIRELTRRGLDAESLVRYGMIPEILGPVLGVLLVHHILPRSDIEAGLRKTGVDVEGWRALLRIPSSAGDGPAAPAQVQDLVLEVSQNIFPPLLNWMRYARLDELVQLILPEEGQFWSTAGSAANEAKIRHQYRWLVDRFTQTYLANWSLSSLYLEYRWQKDLDPACFPTVIMKDRSISFHDLTAEIAHRAVLDGEASSDAPPSTTFLMGELESHAFTLLRDGKFSEAATLFNFAVRQWQNDPRAYNNLGFCLIPEDPPQALEYLNSAARMGYEPCAINAYNKMCCHLKMYQPRIALAVAEEFWEARPDGPETTGVIWRVADGRWRLEQGAHVRAAIVEMAISITEAHGGEDDRNLWRGRA